MNKAIRTISSRCINSNPNNIKYSRRYKEISSNKKWRDKKSGTKCILDKWNMGREV